MDKSLFQSLTTHRKPMYFWVVFVVGNILLTLIFFLIRFIMMINSQRHFEVPDGRKVRPFSDALLVSVMNQSTIGDSGIVSKSRSAVGVKIVQGLSIFAIYGFAIVALVKVREN
jgi:hypothetical protein